MNLTTHPQTIDTALLIQVLAEKARWHTFLGNGGCDIDSAKLIRYVNDRPDGVGVMPESTMAYRLDHKVAVIDEDGCQIGIEIPLESVQTTNDALAAR